MFVLPRQAKKSTVNKQNKAQQPKKKSNVKKQTKAAPKPPSKSNGVQINNYNNVVVNDKNASSNAIVKDMKKKPHVQKKNRGGKHVPPKKSNIKRTKMQSKVVHPKKQQKALVKKSSPAPLPFYDASSEPAPVVPATRSRIIGNPKKGPVFIDASN